MTRFRLEADKVVLEGTLNDSDTAAAIKKALPITGRVNRWGDEFYFAIPLELDEAEGAQAEVELGALAYWPPSKAFCIWPHPGQPRQRATRGKRRQRFWPPRPQHRRLPHHCRRGGDQDRCRLMR